MKTKHKPSERSTEMTKEELLIKEEYSLRHSKIWASALLLFAMIMFLAVLVKCM